MKNILKILVVSLALSSCVSRISKELADKQANKDSIEVFKLVDSLRKTVDTVKVINLDSLKKIDTLTNGNKANK